ncbi:MAG: DUF262 domain-containing protein [Nitrospirota bacterium]
MRRGEDNKKSKEDVADVDIEPTSDGTEYEEAGITKPFNPSLINILTKQMSLDTLMKRLRENEIDLAPDFQRGEVWGATAKSRLIESLLIRIPLPAFYMDATEENNWLVVDGLQRLSTLRDFVVLNKMALQDLEFLIQFHGFKYSDLPRNYQRRIEETQVTVYLVEKGTPPEVKFNIFKRINTGGLPLSQQEIRHALNQGPVTSYLKSLAESKEFLQATDSGVNDKRMAARECVLRFLAFTLTSPKNYKASDFDAFLIETMNALNKTTETQRAQLGRRLIRALKASYDIFGDAAFRKPTGKSRSPVNKALFEVWTVTMDNQSDDDLRKMQKLSDRVKKHAINLMQTDKEFLDSISQGTGDSAKVRLRFSRFRTVLEESLS